MGGKPGGSLSPAPLGQHPLRTHEELISCLPLVSRLPVALLCSEVFKGLSDGILIFVLLILMLFLHTRLSEIREMQLQHVNLEFITLA